MLNGFGWWHGHVGGQSAGPQARAQQLNYALPRRALWVIVLPSRVAFSCSVAPVVHGCSSADSSDGDASPQV